MTTMAKYLLVLLTFISFQLNSQIIPKDWEGKWVGGVQSWTYNSQIDSFGMSIEITPKDSIWDFVLFYDRAYQGNLDIREYQLIIEDESKYHLAIDEKNSIFLDCFVYDNCLYNRFSGMGSDLQIRMCVAGTTMEYEITSYASEPIRISGNEVIQKDTIPEIKSYDLNFFMRGKLTKEQRK